MKTWGPETRSDCFFPSTFDDRMRGSSGVEGPGWLAETGLGGLGGILAAGPGCSFVNSRTARPSLNRWLVFEDTLDWCLYYSLLYWALYFWNHIGGVPELSQTFPEKVCVFCFVFP